jgi:hypothetical protein
MPRMIQPLLFSFAAPLVLAGSLAAQSAQNTPPPSAAQQTESTPPTKQTPPAKARTETKKANRVWTDENIGSLAGKSQVSVVGQGSRSSDASAKGSWGADEPARGRNGATSPEKDPQYYRQQLAPLRSEIARMDARIEQLRHPDSSGKSGGAVNLSQRYILNSPEEQIQILEKRKREVQGKIDAIEDEARRNSINPGDLR